MIVHFYDCTSVLLYICMIVHLCVSMYLGIRVCKCESMFVWVQINVCASVYARVNQCRWVMEGVRTLGPSLFSRFLSITATNWFRQSLIIFFTSFLLNLEPVHHQVFIPIHFFAPAWSGHCCCRSCRSCPDVTVVEAAARWYPDSCWDQLLPYMAIDPNILRFNFSTSLS